MFFASLRSPKRTLLALCGVVALAVGFAYSESSAITAVPSSTSFSNSDSSSLAFLSGFDEGTSPAAALSAAVTQTGRAPYDGSDQYPAGNAANRRQNRYSPSRYAFELGAGVNTPIANAGHVLTWGGNLTAGAGLHLSRAISLLAEFQFIDDKLPGRLIAQAGADGGDAKIWSFTLAPVIDFFPHHVNSMYLTGGGGFYRKLTTFTDSVPVLFCDPYYFWGCGVGSGNVVVSHFSSNQGGANLGVGFTHRLAGIHGNTKLFAEARYLYINTPKIGEINGLGTTGLIPVTLGVRW